MSKLLTNTVIVEEVKPFLLDKLPKITAMVDTGYSLEETKNIIIRMYPNVDFAKTELAIILLRRLDEKEKEAIPDFLVGEPIVFSYDWNNKLGCRIFTTIRLYQPSKNIVGNYHDILLQARQSKAA